MQFSKRCTPRNQGGSIAAPLLPKTSLWMKIRFGLGVLVERGIHLFCDVVDFLAPALLAGAAAGAGEEPEKTEEEMEKELCSPFLTRREVLDEWIYYDIT